MEKPNIPRLVSEYIDAAFQQRKLAVDIQDGIVVEELKSVAVLTTCESLLKEIIASTGFSPIDVSKPFNFGNAYYDGESLHGEMDELKRQIRGGMYKPKSFLEYQKACVAYYCTTKHRVKNVAVEAA